MFTAGEYFVHRHACHRFVGIGILRVVAAGKVNTCYLVLAAAGRHKFQFISTRYQVRELVITVHIRVQGLVYVITLTVRAGQHNLYAFQSRFVRILVAVGIFIHPGKIADRGRNEVTRVKRGYDIAA